MICVLFFISFLYVLGGQGSIDRKEERRGKKKKKERKRKKEKRGKNEERKRKKVKRIGSGGEEECRKGSWERAAGGRRENRGEGRPPVAGAGEREQGCQVLEGEDLGVAGGRAGERRIRRCQEGIEERKKERSGWEPP